MSDLRLRELQRRALVDRSARAAARSEARRCGLMRYAETWELASLLLHEERLGWTTDRPRILLHLSHTELDVAQRDLSALETRLRRLSLVRHRVDHYHDAQRRWEPGARWIRCPAAERERQRAWGRYNAALAEAEPLIWEHVDEPDPLDICRHARLAEGWLPEHAGGPARIYYRTDGPLQDVLVHAARACYHDASPDPTAPSLDEAIRRGERDAQDAHVARQRWAGDTGPAPARWHRVLESAAGVGCYQAGWGRSWIRLMPLGNGRVRVEIGAHDPGEEGLEAASRRAGVRS